MVLEWILATTEAFNDERTDVRVSSAGERKDVSRNATQVMCKIPVALASSNERGKRAVDVIAWRPEAAPAAASMARP
jgi:hypothetical protein